MKNLAKPAAIVIFLVLALVATIFGVRQGVRYFLGAEEPTPSPTLAPLPPFTPSPVPSPPPTYNLQDFQEFLNAMGTTNTEWDLDGNGVVDETDLAIFRTRYRP